MNSKHVWNTKKHWKTLKYKENNSLCPKRGMHKVKITGRWYKKWTNFFSYDLTVGLTINCKIGMIHKLFRTGPHETILIK